MGAPTFVRRPPRKTRWKRREPPGFERRNRASHPRAPTGQGVAHRRWRRSRSGPLVARSLGGLSCLRDVERGGDCAHRAEGRYLRVAIVGGGVMGCSVAMSAADLGADVVVLERAVPGAEASSAAAGILGAQVELDGRTEAA